MLTLPIYLHELFIDYFNRRRIIIIIVISLFNFQVKNIKIEFIIL